MDSRAVSEPGWADLQTGARPVAGGGGTKFEAHHSPARTGALSADSGLNPRASVEAQ
jgi:hypothetical protein